MTSPSVVSTEAGEPQLRKLPGVVLGILAAVVEASSPPRGAPDRMVAGAHVRRDGVPGRYVGTITVSRAGKGEVAVSWPRRAGRGAGTLFVLVP